MRASEQGYALLLAIAVVAVLSLAVLASARAQGDVAASAVRLSERSREAIAAESLMTRVAFLVLTEDADGRALHVGDGARREGDEVLLDGTRYSAPSMPRAFLSVQDEGGLFNVNAADEQGLAALLALSGAGRDSATLAAAMLDYADEDDVARDRGGEAREYLRARMAPPINQPVSSRWQALEVLGWRGSGLQGSRVWDWLAAGPPETALNINTAPAPVLEAVLGDRRRAETIMRRREASPLTDVAEVQALTGGTTRADGLTLAVAPASAFRVQAVFGTHPRRLHGMERRLELGGSEATRPFRWTEEREIGLALAQDGEAVNPFPIGSPPS